MPGLRGVSLSGGSRVNMTGFDSTDALALTLSGGSEAAGDIIAGAVDMDLSGGSSIALAGGGNNLVVAGSGGSDLQLKNFEVHNGDITLSGGGEAAVNVNGTLDVYLSGGSSLIYLGNPTLGSMRLSGGSTITKG